ncbi:MAG: ferredoxin [Planctomycetes bacterium]|nr:ferredoxin [Planctomycetota bacterium]
MPKPAHVVIRHKAAECIGCCACAEVIPHIFEMDRDGMAVLIGGIKNGVHLAAEVPDMDLLDIQTAVDDCPVNIIRVDRS